MHRADQRLVLSTSLILAFLCSSTIALADPTDFQAGVKAYRNGDYAQARLTFQQLHQLHPEDTDSTYYLAISEAQLGRYRQAEKLYQEILNLNPKSEAAKLAREGLQYLPTDDSSPHVLDQPPRFQAQKQTGAIRDTGGTPTATTATPAGQLQNMASGATGLPANMTPQDMMLWQMMMGQMGSGNNNGMNNMMPWAMMPQADPSNPAGGGNIDPNIMSTMLMNQMMQGFSLDGNADKDR